MPTQPRLAVIATVQQAISTLLTTYEPQFLQFGYSLFLAFGYAMIAFYAVPIPGIGISFSHLITDQTHEFANILDASSLELTFQHLDELWQHFQQPDAWALLA